MASSAPSTSPLPCDPPDCNDKKDCTNDKCNEGKCGHTNKPDGVSCALPAASATGTPASSSTPASGTEGFCKGGTCIEKNCKNVYGDNYESCGKGPGLNCCFKGKCCHKEHCCKPNEECTFFGILGFGEWYCSPQSCPSHLPIFCQADNKNVCCEAGSTCIYRSEGTFQGAECGKTECDTEAGEHECPPGGGYFTGGVKCCTKNEECDSNNEKNYPLCLAKSCEEGETFCRGKNRDGSSDPKKVKDRAKDFAWRTRCCKNGVEFCSWNPNGYPLCMPLDPTLSPTPSPS